MLYHMLADEVMRLGDKRFRLIYDQCKADIAGRCPGHTKAHIHNAALNRTATFLAKEIWRVMSAGESMEKLKSRKHVNPADMLGETDGNHSRKSV